MIKSEWLNYWRNISPDFIDVAAQKNILIDKANPENFTNSLKELFKYFTKIVSKTNEIEYKKTTHKNSIYITTEKKEIQKICVPALDIIFCSMYKKRVYEPFGIKAIKEDINELIAEKYQHLIYQTKTWEWMGEDWINESEELTNFKADKYFNQLIENIVY
jgi:hypothetical protein